VTSGSIALPTGSPLRLPATSLAGRWRCVHSHSEGIGRAAARADCRRLQSAMPCADAILRSVARLQVNERACHLVGAYGATFDRVPINNATKAE